MSLIAECISNDSNLVMHLTVWHKWANLAGCVNYHLVWYHQCEFRGSRITCTARVHREYVTNAQPLTMVRQVKLLWLIWIRPPQQLTFHRQLRKKKAMLTSWLLLEYSAVVLFSTALHIECMAQMVQQNCPSAANMVRLSRTLFRETVTDSDCMKWLESKLTLLKCTG